MDIRQILALGVKRNASDVHFSAGFSPIFRIDGDLISISEIPPLNADTTQKLIYSVMDKDQQQEFEKNRDFDFCLLIPHVASFRVNVFRQKGTVAGAFRIIPEKIPTMDELQLPNVLKNLLNLPNGLILVTGPTGSGKSTTLAAMVDYINSHQTKHIITIEDPIEFSHVNKKSLINQREVRRDTPNFAQALRSALREDPDVILVGEMRDLRTIRLALTAAETGHLVMGTIHTSSAPRTITRIVDVFPAGEKNMIRNMLSESLQAVLCQTLLKKNPEGRVAAFEIMLGTSAIRNLIREDKIAQMITSIQTGGHLGMCTLEQYTQQLMAKQIISPAITMDAAGNKELFID